MAETFALSDARGVADRDPAERGTLEVRTRALVHLVEIAAGEVDGAVRSRSTLQRATGRGYPRASVRLDRSSAWVELDVAVRWPSPLAATAEQVRDTVLRRVRELSGIDVRRVDVTVHVVSDEAETDAPTRRVE